MMKKGQALVEFVIILPIFILLVFGVVDIGTIIYSRILLEDKMSDVIAYYDNDLSVSQIKENLDINTDKYELIIEDDSEFIEFILTKDIDIITPGLNLVFDNPYVLSVSRSISNEIK